MSAGVALPAGYTVASIADRPDLRTPMTAHNVAVWPEFMLHSPVADRHWDDLFDVWPEFQLCLLDGDGAVVGAHNSAPLAWDGTDAGLPAGWDDQLERSVADRLAGRAPNTLGAIQIVVAKGRQGEGLAGVMLGLMRDNALGHGYGALIACVRPTLKHRYPLIPIERYAAWFRPDGLPLDPWIRLHVRVGGRIARPSPRSMTITGTVAGWEEWTGLAMPESGTYVLEGGVEPMTLDREADRGVYYDSNVWIVHSLEPAPVQSDAPERWQSGRLRRS